MHTLLTDVQTVTAVLTVLLTIYFTLDAKQSTLGKFIVKVFMSMLFLLVAHNEDPKIVPQLLDQQFVYNYDTLLFFGLFFGFWGDVFLVGDSFPLFLSGLISFLLGHVFYVLAFLRLFDLYDVANIAKASPNLVYHAGAVLALSFIIYLFYLSPHVGSLRIPVMCYVVVITFMVLASLVVFHSTDIKREKAQYMVLLGACLFFFSDLGVARQKFVHDTIWNRIICLPAYYIAQIILAYTIGKF